MTMLGTANPHCYPQTAPVSDLSHFAHTCTPLRRSRVVVGCMSRSEVFATAWLSWVDKSGEVEVWSQVTARLRVWLDNNDGDCCQHTITLFCVWSGLAAAPHTCEVGDFPLEYAKTGCVRGGDFLQMVKVDAVSLHQRELLPQL
jgi:hypothetical protein